MKKKRLSPYKKPTIWDYDMQQAPKGKRVNRVQKIHNGKKRTVKEWVRDEVWVLGKCGTITRSYWIPDESRWCMFVAEVPPIAWSDFTGERMIEEGK